MLRIGILHEGKTPPDARAPLSPAQCEALQNHHPVEFRVQPSKNRAFADDEYITHEIRVHEDLSGCDVLLGVKEVPVDDLLPNKTYFFFSHTIKKQQYNKKLLLTVLERKITLIDYEVLTDDHGRRLVAFGYYAGLVGAHNGLWTYGKRTGAFELPRLSDCHNYQEAFQLYKSLVLPPIKIVLTGTGKVAKGAKQNLLDMGIEQVTPRDFLEKKYETPVFTQLAAEHYVRPKDPTGAFDKAHFYKHGDAYKSDFLKYAQVADVFLNGIYYDPKAPMFFTREDMRSADFHIQVIADISCDIYPDGAVPCTLRPSTIAEPVYGYDPDTGSEVQAFQPHSIDVMAIDNLPSELPRDASEYFGKQLMHHVIPALLMHGHPDVLERATIARNGKLTEPFAYLKEWVGVA